MGGNDLSVGLCIGNILGLELSMRADLVRAWLGRFQLFHSGQIDGSKDLPVLEVCLTCSDVACRVFDLSRLA